VGLAYLAMAWMQVVEREIDYGWVHGAGMAGIVATASGGGADAGGVVGSEGRRMTELS
jgi:hypothetical protein